MEYPLGRKVQHDVRSLNFPAKAELPVKTKSWRRYGAILDQGDVGACTGNAAAQAANSVPYRFKGKILTETDALALYTRATQLDAWPGEYPLEDTGSSGLAVAKAGVEMGLWTRYEWAFGFEHALASLMEGPLLIGTNWHEDMFWPDARGFVKPTGQAVGGHEYLLSGVNVRSKYLTFTNSWSALWGDKGRFHMTFDDFASLLADDGDAILLRK
jgi:hypothetical protein